MNVPSSIKCAADELLCELESSCLEVALVPQRRRTNEDGMIRVAVSKNARWYRDFCATWPSSRVRRNQAPDTRIKRQATIRTLRALAEGEFRETAYFSRLYTVSMSRARRTSKLGAAS